MDEDTGVLDGIIAANTGGDIGYPWGGDGCWNFLCVLACLYLHVL